MIKLAAFDIDDTLTKGSTSIPDENLRAINEAREAGVYVTIATGRGIFASTEICKVLGIHGPIIVFGGSVIYDTSAKRILFSSSFSDENIREIFDVAHELNVHAHLYHGDSIYFEHDNPYALKYRSFLNIPYEIVPDLTKRHWENVPNILFVTEPDRANELIPVLQKRFLGKYKVSGSKAGFVEFNQPTAHKGSALAKLAEMMNISQNETAAMGDNLLDIEMIKWAGIGGAVADSHPEILRVADVIAPSCTDNGAAWFIRNCILKGY